ncbi:hypothetical protein [Streptomyces sp. NPDC060027]|uniref:hypothetical protein n=1 Tax=Streptomyces sp. NPDC060027 TaxID=3347040 RepID=UPI0036BDE22A
MTIQITAVRLSPGGTTHEHIIHLWWTEQASGKTGDNPRAQIVDWIENQAARPTPATEPGTARKWLW